MSEKSFSSLVRYLAQIVVVAALYYITARLGFLIALPPGNVTVLWPPSGLALAALLTFGWHTSLGILVGSFLVNLGTMSGPTALPVAAAIAVGSTLQAWVAAWLIRGVIKALPPATVGGTLKAVGCIALATLFAPLIGVTSLYLAGLAPLSNYPTLVWTWWLGDFIGIQVFTPSLVVFSMRWRKQKVSEPVLWPLTGLIIGLALFTFFVISIAEQQRVNSNLKSDATEMTLVLQSTLNSEIRALSAIRAFYNSSEEVTSAEFNTFTSPLLASSLAASGFEWIPRVQLVDRPTYEQSIRAQDFADFSIYEKDSQGKNVPAAVRAEYFPVTLINPFTPNQAAFGFDLGSNPTRLETILRARDSGELAATAPIQLVQETGKQAGVLIIMPIYRNGTSAQTVEARRENLAGLVLGVYRMENLVVNALQSINQHNLELYLYDVENPESPQFLAFYPSISGPQTLPETGAPAPTTLQTGVYQATMLKIGGRDWLVVIRPGPRYTAEARTWIAWLPLFIGLLVVGALLSYVSNRQKTEANLARSEAEFRNLSESALTGVMRQQLSGKILYANNAFAQMFGCASPQDLLEKDIRQYISNPNQFRAMLQDLQSGGQTRNQEIDILTVTGEKRSLLCSASLQGNIVSATLVDMTERIRSEEEIHQLSLAVSQMAETVVITDTEGVIEYVNPAFERLSGYSRAEVLGKTPRMQKSGMYDDEFYANLWQTILRGDVFEAEIVNRKKNGELYTEAKTISPIRNAEGVITHFVSTGRDVTERKQAELAVRESETRISAISDNLTSADLFVYVREQDGSSHYEYVSASLERLTGVSPEEALKDMTKVRDVFLPEYRAQLIEAENQSWENLTRLEVELCLRHALTGKIAWVLLRATPYRRLDGSTYWYGVHIDITARKQIEEVLARQSEQLRTLYEASQLLNRTLDLNDIYQTICDFMSVVAPNDALVISAFDQATQLITCRAYWLDQKWLEVSSFPAIPLEPEGKGTQSRVIRSGQSMLIGDYQAHLKSTQTNYYVRGETNEIIEEPDEDVDVPQSALVVALKDGDAVTGVIQVMSYRKNVYTEDQLKLLESLALHIVSAEKNARLYAQVQSELNERRQAEAALRRKEADYRLIADNTGDVIWILDLETEKFAYMSPSVEKLLGYTSPDVPNLSISDVLTPASLSYVVTVLSARRDTFNQRHEAITYTDELEQTRKDGSVVPTEVATTFVTNEAGKLQVVGISRDISERRRAEERQREQQNLMEYHYHLVEILTTVSTHFINLPVDQINTEIGRALEQLGEFERADRSYVFLINREQATMTNTHEWCAPGVEAQIENLEDIPLDILPWWMGKMEHGQEVYIPLVSQLPPEAQAEREILEPQGIQSLLAVPLISNNLLIGFVGFDAVRQPRTWDADSILIVKMMGDIISNALTRRQADQVLRSSEDKFAKAFHSSPDSMVISSMEDGRMLEVNDGFLLATGYSREEVIGYTSLQKNIWATAIDRANLADVLASARHVHNLEAKFRLKSGEIRDGLVSAEVIELENGQKRLLMVVRDITELKQATILQETVYRIAEAAQAAESLQELYPQIQRQIAGVMFAENFYIALYDETTDLIHFVFSVDEIDIRRESVPLGKGLTAHVLRTGESLLYVPEKDTLGIEVIGVLPKVWLGAPLIVQGKTIGVMAVQHYSDAQIYTEREQHILEFVSSQVATTIDRKRTAEAVRLVEKRNSALIENAPDGVALLDADGRFVFGSPTMKRIYGYLPEELLGVPARDLMHPDDRYIVDELRQKFAETPFEIFTATYRVRHKDGNYLWIECAYTNMFHDPSVQALVLNFRDITEQKLAREMLEKSQASLENAQSIAHLGSWELNPNSGTGLFWSKEMYHLFHRDPAQGVPPLEEFMQLVHPDDRQPLLETQQRAIETGVPGMFEYRTHPALGAIRFFRVTIQPVQDAQGQLLHVTGTVLDVTESRLMEANLRERMKELTCLFKVGRLLQDTTLSEDALGQQVIADLIPAMQFSELTVPLLKLGDKQYTTERYRDTLSHCLSAVIEVNKAAYGNLSVYYLNDEPFIIPEEQTLLDNIAGMLGVWLERRQAENNAIYRQELLEKVLQLGKNITTITDLDQCLRAIHQNIQKGLGFDRVGLFLYDAERQFIRGAYGTSRTGQMEDNSWYGLPSAEWPNWQMALRSQTGMAIEADYQAAHQPAPDNEMYGVRQHISLAAWVGDKPVALITVDNLVSKRPIIPADLEALQLFAGYVGLAIENARLRTGLEQRVEERTAEVRRSEATYRALFENSNDGIFLISPTSEEIAVNHRALDMLGYTLEEYRALPPNAVAASDEREDADQRFATVLHGEQVLLYERTFIHKNGQKVDVEINLSPVRDPSGNIIMVQSVVRDITARKRAEEAVRQSEETYRALFENANDAIFLISPDGFIQRVNERATELLGYTAEELIGRQASDFIVLAEVDEAQAVTNQLLAGTRIPVYERRFIRKDETQIETEINLSLIAQSSGQPKLIQSVVRDITARKRAEQALRESRDQLSMANAALEKASRLKDEFLASMSHELRTPLTSILGISEAMQLQTQGGLTEKQLKALKTIHNSGRHLLDLINDILDLSKIEAGKLDMQFEPCQVSDICQASLQLVKGMAQQKKQNVSFSMNPPMITVRADPRRLKQMLVNLLSNAVKFTPEGGLLGLEVQTNQPGSAVLLTVWDKGIGIQPEDLGKLFKPFVQLDSRLARQYSGTGLGLSLVQRMAELHGGSIQVESAPGEGSRFTIALPWSANVTQPVHELISADSGSVRNVLIIEDNSQDIEHISRYLKELDITGIIHPTMNGALKKAAFLCPSVILLDLNLPDGSGLDLLAKLKADERTRNIPVIIVSVEERRSETARMGALGYLLKPFTRQELRLELEKAAAFARPAEPALAAGLPDTAPLVLITDDNEQILEMLNNFLGSNGYRIAVARSGYELLECAPELHPDLMLVDIQMPGMDGLEAIRRLRAHSDPTLASTPIIAVTALAMTGDREKCLQAGANEYVSKPIALAKLVEQIKSYLIPQNE